MAAADDDALLVFTQANHDGPATAALFAERAQAFIRKGNFAAATARPADFNPTMCRAYFCKASARIILERYGSAKAAVEVGASRFAELVKELDDKLPPSEASPG